jgi:hypothetical protein
MTRSAAAGLNAHCNVCMLKKNFFPVSGANSPIFGKSRKFHPGAVKKSKMHGFSLYSQIMM